MEVATPIGLSEGYWKESVAIASAERALVIEFPWPSRRVQVEATPRYDPDSEQYQSLMHFLSRNVKEFFAFNLAPLALVLYQEQRLFLKNAVDVQSAFPEWKRNNISGILKAALSDETKIHELLVTETFNDITYGPEYRTAALGPVKRACLHIILARLVMLSQHIAVSKESTQKSQHFRYERWRMFCSFQCYRVLMCNFS